MITQQLTFTRFIAALTVIFFHFASEPELFPATLPWLKEFVTAGPTAVSYFFALSGFIMAVAYYRPEQSVAKQRYWVARIARIYPLYLLALALMIASKLRGADHSWLNDVLHLGMLQAWVPGHVIALNVPGWSLSVEIIFYLCFPFFITWVHKSSWKVVVLSVVGLWLVSQVAVIGLFNSAVYAPKNHWHDIIFYNPLMHLNVFLLGVVVGIALHKKIATAGSQQALQSANGWKIALLMAFIITVFAVRPALEQILNVKIAYNNGLIAPLFLALIVLLTLNNGWTARVLSWSPLVLLGEASYAMYIMQQPLHGIYKRSLAKLDMPDVVHLYLFISLLIGLSIALYYLVEVPARQSLRKHLN